MPALTKRRISIAAIVALVLCSIVAWALASTRQNRTANKSNLRTAVNEAVSDPVHFAKERVNGGIGVALGTWTNGFPIVHSVIKGSPAEDAGLRAGDIILKIDGQSAQGKTIVQVVEEIRGLSVGRVALLVRRGESDQECVISRASWNSLKKLPVQ